MEKLTSKRRLFAGMLALSAGFILASCDPVSALPTKYNDSIVQTKVEIDDNNLGTLYDQISGDKNEKVLNKVLYEIAERKFGSYKDFKDACSSKEAFIKNHEDLFGTGENAGKKFDNYKADILARISEYFYNEITSGSYNDEDGRFSEEKLYNAHRYELYDLGSKQGVTFKKFFVTKELKKDTAFDELNGSLYQLVTENKDQPVRGYIQEKVYPEIIRNKFVEDYIYKNNNSSLGRAYGRKVNFVKVPYENEFKFERDVMEKFSLNYIEKDVAFNFEKLVDAVKGFQTSATHLASPVSSDVAALYAKDITDTSDPDFAKNFIVVPNDSDYSYQGIGLVEDGTYSRDSKLGQILEEYAKACEGEDQGRFPTPENKTALESFTSDGKSKEYGLLQKLISLVKEDYTQDGWFVKNGGLSDLPSALRDRLFNIRVSNVLDDSTQLFNENSEAKIGTYQTYYDNHEPKLSMPYLRNIYGKKLLLPTNAMTFENNHYNYIYQDRDGKAFYIVQVEEAPSTAKLAKSSTVYNAVDKEEISRQVAKVLGTKDSYIKDAYTSEINEYFKDIEFFDTSLYEYLKGEYPDLNVFDD